MVRMCPPSDAIGSSMPCVTPRRAIPGQSASHNDAYPDVAVESRVIVADCSHRRPTLLRIIGATNVKRGGARW
jgi:hypothetical protein